MLHILLYSIYVKSQSEKMNYKINLLLKSQQASKIRQVNHIKVFVQMKSNLGQKIRKIE